MNCCDHTCDEGRDCPNRMLTNTHRVVVPFNTGKVQIGRSYTPRVTAQQAQAVERYRPRSSSMLASRGFWICGAACLVFWHLLYSVLSA